MSNVTPSTDLRMIVVPIEGTLVGAPLPNGNVVVLTASTEAGPRVGGFEPVRDTPATLVSSGDIDSGIPNVTVSTVLAGSVGSATWSWTPTGESKLYWDPPTSVTGFEIVDRSVSAARYLDGVHAVRCPDTGLLLAVASDNTSSPYNLLGFRQDLRGKWSSVTILAGYAPVSCLVVVPNGTAWRYLCFYPYGSPTGGIQMSYSDDSGATWSVGSTRCTRRDVYTQAEIVRIRAAYLNGKILLLVHYRPAAGTDSIDQWVSTDGGGTFSRVEVFSSSLRAYPDIAVYNGAFYVAYLKYETGRVGSDLFPGVRVLGDASQPLTTSGAGLGDVMPEDVSWPMEWGTQAASEFTAGECAIVVDDDGVVYVYGLDFAGTREGICRVYKAGAWQDPYLSGHASPVGVCWWSGQDTSTYPRNLCAVLERGRVALLHTAVGNPIDDDASIFVAMLGGWTSIGMPEDDTYDDGLGVAGWERIWLPYDEPEVIGATWTRTLVGAATASLGATGITLTSTAAQSIYYTATPAMTGAYDTNGVILEVHVRVTSGSYLMDAQISNGAASYYFRITVTPTSMVLRDMTASADLWTVSATTAADGVAIRIHAYATSFVGNNGAVKAWYRQDGPWSASLVNWGPRQYREWTAFGTGAFTGRTVGVAVAASVLWGQALSSTTSVTRMAAFTDGLYAISSTPGTRGRVLTGPASPLHLTGGLRMHATSGPTIYGDTWTHTPAHDYPVEHVDPVRHPSPRARHRTTTMSLDADLLWTTDIGWRAATDPIAIYIAGANWRTATLYRDALGASKVCDIDLAKTGLGYTRSRNLIIPASGGAALGFFAHKGALEGATVDLGAGDLRHVRTNEAGAWLASTAPADYPSTRITLEAYEAADAASGTLDLWMPGGLFLVEGLQATDTLLFRIPGQTTADGYIETGTILIGRPHVLRDYAQGRARTWQPNTELTTLDTGIRMARRRGATRRTVELSWSDPVDTLDVSGTVSTAPDHYTLGYVGAPAVAAPGGTPTTIAGILAATDGARVPVVYCSAIKQPSSTLTALAPQRELDPTLVLYGRITSDSWRADSPAGAENRNEAVRGGALVIEEEL